MGSQIRSRHQYNWKKTKFVSERGHEQNYSLYVGKSVQQSASCPDGSGKQTLQARETAKKAKRTKTVWLAIGIVRNETVPQLDDITFYYGWHDEKIASYNKSTIYKRFIDFQVYQYDWLNCSILTQRSSTFISIKSIV